MESHCRPNKAGRFEVWEPELRMLGMLGMLGIAIGMLGNHRRVQWKALQPNKAGRFQVWEPEPRMLGMLGIAIGMLGNHRRVQWKAIVDQIRQVGSKLEDSMASRFSDFANGRLGIRSRMPDIDQR